MVEVGAAQGEVVAGRAYESFRTDWCVHPTAIAAARTPSISFLQVCAKGALLVQWTGVMTISSSASLLKKA
jgi:hypothetical protein